MENETLHIVMLPWVAMGHLLPFLELSKRIAKKGHRISFLSTPRNIQMLLPKIPTTLSSFINLVSLPLPHVDGLPATIENTADVPSEDLRHKLTLAYKATFDHELSSFLRRSPADWIICDFAACWVPRVAADHGASWALFSLFNAAALSFFGPPSVMNGGSRTEPEHFTTVPNWVPFPTTIAFRLHEVRQLFNSARAGDDGDDKSAGQGFAAVISESPFVAIRSCMEFEPDWLELLGKLYNKPVIPVGLFPPSPPTQETTENRWAGTYEWLDKQEPGSVVYAAFGSEARLTSAQVLDVGLGLETSGLPFVWALRADADSLPEGLEGRVEGRGIVCKDWVPQDRFLAHPSVGGFLTHGGWNSIIEGLSVGVVMVLLPLVYEQGLNARHLVEKGVGVEVPRDEEDGSFTGDGIAKSLRLVMVDEEGEGFRVKAREYKEMFGDEEMHERCVGKFVEYLIDHRPKHASSKPT